MDPAQAIPVPLVSEAALAAAQPAPAAGILAAAMPTIRRVLARGTPPALTPVPAIPVPVTGTMETREITMETPATTTLEATRRTRKIRASRIEVRLQIDR